MSERVHAHGAKLALLLVHSSKNAVEDIVGPSPARTVPPEAARDRSLDGDAHPDEIENMGTPSQVQGGRVEFREMTRDDIARMNKHAEAVRARSGHDACELHAGHGYLIDNFLADDESSRGRVRRSVENRARFLVEILEAIRERVGRDYPVWVRINGGEAFVEGETLEDACRVAELAEAAGSDAVHVSLYADPARANRIHRGARYGHPRALRSPARR